VPDLAERAVCGVPHGSRQNPVSVHPKAAILRHLRGAVQSEDAEHSGSSVRANTAQKQFPSTSCEQRQDLNAQPGEPPQFADSHVKQSVHGAVHVTGYWANAGVRRLDNTGADQAIAEPAPIRFNILRREIRSGLIDDLLSRLWESMSGRARGAILPSGEFSYVPEGKRA
jgi:hypothetical protein